MSFKDYNLSSLLDEKIKDPLTSLIELVKNNPSIRASAHGLNYELTMPVVRKEISFFFGVEEMEWEQKGNAALISALFKKEGEKSFDFAGLLSSGSPLFDMEGHFAGLRFSMKQGGKEMGAGEMAQSDFQFYLKPDDKKEFFTYGFSWELESLKIAASGKNKALIERIGDIKSVNMDFALGHMTPEFIQAYFDMIKENMAATSSGEVEKMQQVQMNQGMRLAGEFAKSQPTIRFSLTPLKHYFGTLEAEANFQIQGMPTPIGKATLRLNNMDEVLKNIKEELSLPETVMAWMQSMLVKDGNDGVLTFEIKNEPPVTLYLNGQPIKQPTY